MSLRRTANGALAAGLPLMTLRSFFCQLTLHRGGRVVGRGRLCIVIQKALASNGELDPRAQASERS
jgi:hypothetical protein